MGNGTKVALVALLILMVVVIARFVGRETDPPAGSGADAIAAAPAGTTPATSDAEADGSSATAERGRATPKSPPGRPASSTERRVAQRPAAGSDGNGGRTTVGQPRAGIQSRTTRSSANPPGTTPATRRTDSDGSLLTGRTPAGSAPAQAGPTAPGSEASSDGSRSGTVHLQAEGPLVETETSTDPTPEDVLVAMDLARSSGSTGASSTGATGAASVPDDRGAPPESTDLEAQRAATGGGATGGGTTGGAQLVPSPRDDHGAAGGQFARYAPEDSETRSSRNPGPNETALDSPRTSERDTSAASDDDPSPSSTVPSSTVAGFPKKHVIVPNDGYWKLCKKYYGKWTPKLEAHLKAANSKIPMHPGKELVIPAPPEGVTVTVPVTGDRDSAGVTRSIARGTTRSTNQASSSRSQTYLVQKGDTKMGLAKRFYGDPYAYDRIENANPSLKYGGELMAGKTIVIPAK